MMARKQADFGVALMAAAGAVLVGLLLVYCRHGLDITDEGFYLNWIANPFLYENSVFQFGFVYHPVYQALHGDVVLLRQLNVAATVILACTLAFILVRRNPTPSRTSIQIGAETLIFALPVLTLFLWGVMTPSYNALVLQGAIVVTIGLTLLRGATGRSIDLAGLIIGVGGALVALAKPSSAVLIGIAALAVIVATAARPVRTGIVAAAASVAVAGLAILLISGGPAAFIDRILGGHEGIMTLIPRYSVSASLRLDWPGLTYGEIATFWLLAAGALGAVRLARRRPDLERPIWAVLVAAALAASAASILFPWYLAAIAGRPHRTALLLAAVPLGLLIAVLLQSRADPAAREHLKNASAEIALFAFLPYAVAFGTGNNVVQQTSYAALFWGLGAFILSRAVFEGAAFRTAATVILASSLALTVMLVTAGTEVPYRQKTALRLQKTPVLIGPNGDQKLLVDKETARYLEELTVELNRLGYKRGDGIIDMTGESPGIIFAVGGVAIGEPWILGRYVGSKAYAKRALAQVPCEQIAKSWTLKAPKGRRSISDEVLNSVGLNAETVLDATQIRRRYINDHHIVVPPRNDAMVVEACRRLREPLVLR